MKIILMTSLIRLVLQQNKKRLCKNHHQLSTQQTYQLSISHCQHSNNTSNQTSAVSTNKYQQTASRWQLESKPQLRHVRGDEASRVMPLTSALRPQRESATGVRVSSVHSSAGRGPVHTSTMTSSSSTVVTGSCNHLFTRFRRFRYRDSKVVSSALYIATGNPAT